MSQLAFFGGPQAITKEAGDIFNWPIVTKEDEDAVLDVLHGEFSRLPLPLVRAHYLPPR